MNHFDQAALTWDAPEKVAMNLEYARKIKDICKIPGPLSILDIGCGTGLLSLSIAGVDDTVLGLDMSQGMIDVFNQKVAIDDKKRAVILNLEQQNIESQFDLVVSAMAFHHLKNPLAVLAKISYVLKEGGHIVIIDLDQEDGSFHASPREMGVHHSGFSQPELMTWAKELGLSVAHYEIARTIQKNNREYGVFLFALKIAND